nr:unnamed protein product [Haemonchus contortus]
MSMVEILNAMMERNEQLKDPVMAKYINAMVTKLPQTITDAVQAEKKERSLVVFGIPESNSSKPPSVRQQELENRVTEILDCVRVECRPVEVYRMGKPNDTRPRRVFNDIVFCFKTLRVCKEIGLAMALYFSIPLLLVALLLMCSAIVSVSSAAVEQKSSGNNRSIETRHGFYCC